MNDTIAAISTGSLNSPISIIRLSGPDAFLIIKKVFNGKEGTHQSITHGYINDGKKNIDEVLVSWFKGPKTFTGEDIVEINAHGGIINTNNILRLILASGARLAENGEFSRRAFINGKMDLVKAEAIHDLIFSKTEAQTNLAVHKFDGGTSKLINNLTKKLLFIIATIETNIDYPEYDDIEVLNNKTLLPKLKEVKHDLQDIIKSSNSSKYIYEGINVAIVGKPNAGKSSLLNSLIEEDKAIISNLPGTTRDIVEGEKQIGQVLFKFKDTAGIHNTDDSIENMGIKKSLDEIKKDHLIIHVIDGEIGKDKEDESIAKESLNKIYFPVYNKSDLSYHEHEINVSAKNNDVSELIEAIKNCFKDINLNNEKIVNNVRQLSLIEKSYDLTNNAIAGIENGFMPSEVIIDIREAWKSLANVIGEGTDEKLLDEMFKNFCLGK